MSKKKSASHKLTSETPASDTSASDTSASDTSASDTSASDTSASDTSASDTSASDTSASDKEEIIVSGQDEVEATDRDESTSDDKDDTTEVLATDEDPVQIIDVTTGGFTETRAAKPIEAESTEVDPKAESKSRPEPAAKKPAATVNEASPRSGRSFPWFGIFNFLLIVALAAAAAYYWREQQALDAAHQSRLSELQQQVDAGDQAVSQQVSSRLQSSLSPLQGDIGSLSQKVDDLGLGQQDLRDTSEKLFELYGRDKNDWQLAEVEYLMRVAQHRLILQDDFEGAAITLQAASDRLGLTGDPGMLPVRLMISEEIADLKTRRRADLVGMTLKLAQLGRQVRSLQPGFALRVDATDLPASTPRNPDDWLGQFNDFIDSLITIRKESSDPTVIEANIVDVAEALEDNLKLARWAVLERDANQYQLLVDRSLQLFREFYDLDNAANQDFMSQLQELQKMVIRPDKPDITGSLREMQRILSQRENAPPPAVAPAQEPDNG